MKSIITILIISTIWTSDLFSQEYLSIRDVFDFEINDEFHLKGNSPDQPPNADRITVIDKLYSANNDTLFYTYSHDSYWTTIVEDPEPHLEYHFWSDTITKQYFALDSSIFFFDNGYQHDTSIYSSFFHCDSLVDRLEYWDGDFEFEYDYSINSYGKGLGLVDSYYLSGGSTYPSLSIIMFYCKKNGIECGYPDTTTVGAIEQNSLSNEFIVFPNPSNSKVFIENKSSNENYDFQLYNYSGELIERKNCSGKMNEIDLTYVENGLYLLKITENKKIKTFRIIKN